MPRLARESAATQLLQDHVGKQSTGRMTVGVGPGAISVWLLKGAIVAATSPSDERQLLRLVALGNGLPPLRASALGGVLRTGESIFGPLVDEVAPSLIERLLVDRFKANLAEVLGGMSRPTFEAVTTVFVDNLQLGYDPLRLLDECAELVDAAEVMSPDVMVVPGSTPPSTEFGRAVLEKVQRVPTTVGVLMSALAWEPLIVRAWMAPLIASGVVNSANDEQESEEEEDWADDDATENISRPVVRSPSLTPSAAPAVEVASDPASDRASEAVADPRSEAVGDPASEGILDPASEAEGDPASEAILDPASEAAGDPASESVRDPASEPVADPPSESVEEPATPGIAGLEGLEFGDEGPPKRLQSWLNAAHAVDDHELDFFEDHDYSGRGGTGADGGKFTTDTHNLDKVSLDGAAPPEEAIEVDEAPAARFGAPGISEADAFAKIEVINDVLRNVVAAFDENDGAGRGREVVQLLVEGSPNRYAVLFSSLDIPDSGELPPEEVVSNLQSRPPSEQRLLLNQALSDLIERALSTVADELPEEVIDPLLEKTAGYRGRLGL